MLDPMLLDPMFAALGEVTRHLILPPAAPMRTRRRSRSSLSHLSIRLWSCAIVSGLVRRSLFGRSIAPSANSAHVFLTAMFHWNAILETSPSSGGHKQKS